MEYVGFDWPCSKHRTIGSSGNQSKKKYSNVIHNSHDIINLQKQIYLSKTCWLCSEGLLKSNHFALDLSMLAQSQQFCKQCVFYNQQCKRLFAALQTDRSSYFTVMDLTSWYVDNNTTAEQVLHKRISYLMLSTIHKSSAFHIQKCTICYMRSEP